MKWFGQSRSLSSLRGSSLRGSSLRLHAVLEGGKLTAHCLRVLPKVAVCFCVLLRPCKPDGGPQGVYSARGSDRLVETTDSWTAPTIGPVANSGAQNHADEPSDGLRPQSNQPGAPETRPRRSQEEVATAAQKLETALQRLGDEDTPEVKAVQEVFKKARVTAQ